jgi:hypothetical protein
MGACQCSGLSPNEQSEVIANGAVADFEVPGQPDAKEEFSLSRASSHNPNAAKANLSLDASAGPGVTRPFTEPSSSKEAGARLPPSLLRTAHITLSFIRKLQANSSKRNSAEGPSEPAPPDFSGDWLLHRLEGDPEALLKEVGASWVQRKAAAAMAFGVGRQHVHVEQCPDSIRVETRYRQADGGAEMAFPKPTNNFYNTVGVEQDIVDPEGRTIKSRVHWDGQKLVMVSERVGDEVPLPSTRRYLQDEGEEPELVFEQSSANTGVFVKRIYRRCEKPEGDGGKSVKSGKSMKAAKTAKSVKAASM